MAHGRRSARTAYPPASDGKPFCRGGPRWGATKSPRMARTLRTLHETDLEAALLRKSVGSLTAGRATCADCGRTPLVGERMYRFGRHAAVCALCTPQRS